MWIELDVILVNKKMQDMDLQGDEVTTPMSFLKSEICAYRRVITDEGDEAYDETCIILKNGFEFYVAHSYNAIKSLFV